ncbi:MAG TPA: pyruvate kinase [Acidobacteriota bacterium]|nr:pyruvate kinase [Acidobacteriota bacterium]
MGQIPRKTKILATLGPASCTPDTIDDLLLAGADGFRLNCSHGSHESFQSLILQIRETSRRLGKSVAILMDLQGPKIRTSMLKDHRPVELVRGNRFTITTREVEGTAEAVSTTYRELPLDVHAGDAILIDDGNLELRVLRTTDTDVETEVVVGGTLSEKKGINLPGVAVSAPSLTDKDLADAKFGAEMGVDYIALSFVRTAWDVLVLKNLLNDLEQADLRIIAKIEKPEAVKNLREILEVSDGVMVARGDLGVEMAAEKVPLIQKMIIEKANKSEKLVITATQMLESMVNSARPTRAEASDVANAILDGTDVVMLSQETAAGKYPVKAVKTMSSIAQYTESDDDIFSYTDHIRPERLINFTHGIVHSARAAAMEMKAKAILVFTQSGFTAHLASCQRPPCPIYAFTPLERTFWRLALVWGVQPMLFVKEIPETDEMIRKAEEMLLDVKAVQKGDVVIIVSGTQPQRGATNMMKIERIP